jgi:hypothetical protein
LCLVQNKGQKGSKVSSRQSELIKTVIPELVTVFLKRGLQGMSVSKKYGDERL